jgi:hypothetical protein
MSTSLTGIPEEQLLFEILQQKGKYKFDLKKDASFNELKNFRMNFKSIYNILAKGAKL